MSGCPDTNTLRHVFQIIATRGSLSPAELARTTGVSPSTLQENLRRLQKKGLVVARAKESISGTARSKSVRISINPAHGYLVGIDMGASHLHFALTDFAGGI